MKWVSFLLLMLLPLAGQAQTGLVATLQTTLGDIRIQLHYDRAPRTVGNFISLAEGTRPWLDYPGGQAVSRPFYHGLTFHRVMTNFMIQAGSPNGLGNDTPGYTFRDEFSPTLRHTNAGVVSMANSGPNSNGSQFFITVAPTPWLDDVHSVFGQVISGLDVAIAISEVATNATARPLVPVVITNLFMERLDAGAQAFNPRTVSPVLPIVRGLVCNITRTNSRPVILWTPQSNSLFYSFGNLNLVTGTNWVQWYLGTSQGIYIDNIVANTSTAFFRTVQVQSFE